MSEHQEEIVEKGIMSLKRDVQRDIDSKCNWHDYQGKLDWIIDRAKSYADVLGIDYLDVIKAWEEKRTYWYMNYYQECNQPKVKDGVRFFDTVDDFKKSIGDKGFRCPSCKGISTNPYKCTCNKCDWTSYGLFGHLGRGADIYIKSELKGAPIFFPVAWEDKLV